MRLDQVWFRYARRAGWALRDVDAAVRPGETVVVLGRNGAGKSTLLQLAAGVLRPSRGTVQDRPGVVGWVPERFPAEQPFTAEQYLTRMAALRGLPGTARVDHWIERLMLAEHRHTRLADLSKGTAQKVGLAQALLVPPGLLRQAGRPGRRPAGPTRWWWRSPSAERTPTTRWPGCVRRATACSGYTITTTTGRPDDRAGPDAAGRVRAQRPGSRADHPRPGGAGCHLRRGSVTGRPGVRLLGGDAVPGAGLADQAGAGRRAGRATPAGRLALGARREAAAGVLAAAVLALAVCVVSMLAPWPFGAICGPGSGACGPPGAAQPSLAAGIGLGVLAHVLAAAAAIGLGALSSRVVTRTVRNGLTVLVVGAVLAIVLGLKGSIAPWLAPPVMATARALTADTVPGGGTLWSLTAWAVVWSAVALAGYAVLRRGRA